ncbi:transcriptional regulator, LysR family [Anaeromyxobacter dehalogenans 2CP-1]|uniref:Transcriptional regulator, LysR family n=1 Tax=Anaeromyxobacter dehalogenans (strain ATCC BAA-258 / DSM 21875 / 2CP-1) TaxID=455488 RepID=B8J5V0_ANAD2|nr:LysR family transcriptional regulator [Anaeromyxobacter dehalogenans]ACL65047.1 transcriptional regulator, LysR family [Anaeromyxobacter dehalogenans 2CP-1]
MRTIADRHRTATLDWEDVRCFAALARTGSLSGAGRALGVNHATVARRVAALERALGRRLLERRPDGVRLTAAGAAALERARDMERAATSLAADRGAAEAAAVVRVTATRPVIDAFLLPRLARVQERLRGCELELIGESRALSLARHEADLAVRLGSPRGEDLVGRRIATFAYGLYAAPAVARAIAGGARPRWIGFDEGSAHLPEAVWLAEAHPEERPSFRTNGFGSQQLAARAGLGLALLPCYMGDPDPALRRVEGPVPPPRPVWLLRRATSRGDPAIGAVAAALTRLFTGARALFAGDATG